IGVMFLTFVMLISCSKKSQPAEPVEPTPTATNTPYHEFLGACGSQGTAEGELTSIYGTCVDGANNIYVSDPSTGYISKFNSSFIYQMRWGTSLNGNGLLDSAYFISSDTTGNIYVPETWTYRITKFDSSGTILNYWGENGTGQGQFAAPKGIVVNSSNVYVLDDNNKRIQKFDSSGNYLSEFSYVISGDPSTNYHSDLKLDTSGNFYILNHDLKCIKKFDSSGNFVKKWGESSYNPGGMPQPKFIAIYGNTLYVTDLTREIIIVFDLDGNFKYEIYGYTEGGIYKRLSNPEALAVDSAGNIYVSESDTGVRRIVKLSGTLSYE
ncbi:MAG: hypothetical protein JXR81_03715, partial [Candidatus Goldbacteria bacterium]|nr:hypothetical protein [Candidatus Goldiibacteriota bacterium]